MKSKVRMIALLLAVAMAACGGGNGPTGPTSPPPGGDPNWSQLVNLTIKPKPVAPHGIWDADVEKRVNQSGLEYKVEWILREPSGKETVLRVFTGMTQALGGISLDGYQGEAPFEKGEYRLIHRLTEKGSGQEKVQEISGVLPVN